MKFVGRLELKFPQKDFNIMYICLDRKIYSISKGNKINLKNPNNVILLNILTRVSNILTYIGHEILCSAPNLVMT